MIKGPVSGNAVNRSKVVLVGRPFVPIGIGEHIRCSYRALRSIGMNVGLRDVYGEEVRDLYGEDVNPDLTNEFQNNLAHEFSRDLNVFHTNGDEVDLTLLSLGADLPGDAYNVIYPMWELSRYPKEWAKQLNRFDEIWAPSKFTYGSIAPAVVKPVLHMPLAAEIRLKTFLGRRYFEIPESSFTFLFSFDLTSYIERKNPFAVLQAFEGLCSLRPDDDLCLVIKLKGGEMKGQDYERFSEYVARLKSRLIVIDRLLTDNEMKNLLRCCDCFVSLHRSEGFGLGLITAMFLGKPVIATAYSANMDFMTERNSCLVRYQLRPVPDGAYPFGEGQVWADPDIDHAVDHMVKLVSDRDYARCIGNEASRHVRIHFSYRACGLRYSDRISEIATNRSSLRIGQSQR
jgi:glycosyltransferase involved in cell wall biosynthesis